MATATVMKKFRFEAAHWLPYVPEGHKCGRMHGHSYCVEVHVSGLVGSDGFVVDYAVISEAWKPIHERLDHHTLNDYMPNPTCERMAEWLWERLLPALPGLSMLVIQETESTEVRYTGP